MIPTTDNCCCCFNVSQGSFLIGIFLVVANMLNIVSMNTDFTTFQEEEPRSDVEKAFLADYKLVLSGICCLLIVDGICISISVMMKLKMMFKIASLFMFGCVTAVFVLSIIYYILYDRFAILLLDIIGYAFSVYLFVVLWSFHKGEPQDERLSEEQEEWQNKP